MVLVGGKCSAALSGVVAFWPAHLISVENDYSRKVLDLYTQVMRRFVFRLPLFASGPSSFVPCPCGIRVRVAEV